MRQKFYYVDYYVDWEIRSQQLPKFSSAINKVDLSITGKSNDCYFSIISIFMSRDLFTLFHNSSVIYSLHIFTGRNEVVAKVMFLHVSVILFTGGGSPGRENPLDRETPLQGGTPPDQADPPGQGEPPPSREEPPPGPGTPPWTRENTPRTRQTPPGSRLQNTVYERPVRILLECILVYQRITSVSRATVTFMQ